MDAHIKKTVVPLVIIVVIAVIIGAIYYFTIPSGYPSQEGTAVPSTGPTPEEIGTAIQAGGTARKDAIPAAREAQITKAMTASSSPDQQSTISPERQQEINKALQSK